MPDAFVVECDEVALLVEPPVGLRLVFQAEVPSDLLGRVERVDVPRLETGRVAVRVTHHISVAVVDDLLDEVDHVDLDIDGVDEIDPQFNAIKGGGGALYREKVVATLAKEVIWIMDESKLVDKIGAFHLPVEIAQYGSKQAMAKMEEYGFHPVLRVRDDKTFVTDNGNFIADLHLGAGFDIEDVREKISGIVGVLEHGLFLNMCKRMIVGCASGEVKVIENPAK